MNILTIYKFPDLLFKFLTFFILSKFSKPYHVLLLLKHTAIHSPANRWHCLYIYKGHWQLFWGILCRITSILFLVMIFWLHLDQILHRPLFLKLGPQDAWFVFMMLHVSWFAHCVYEKICIIWVDVSFVHSSHLVRQLGSKLTHQSKLYVSDSTNLFDTFTHDAPRIRTTHRVDPA